MTTRKITKLEAAQRQIDCGIRMLFADEDPLAIHTIAMAGFRVLRDLAAKDPDSHMEQTLEQMLAPDKKAEFWGFFQSYANFLKHADQDPDAREEEIAPQANDLTLMIAVLYYSDIYRVLTPEMLALSSWYSALHPNHVRSDAAPAFRAAIDSVGEGLRALNRKEQLEVGGSLISGARQHLCRG